MSSGIGAIVFIIGFLIWNRWRERGLEKEFERNNKFDAPETHQLKWDMRHLREDMNLLCHLMFIAVGLLAIIAFK